MPGRDRETGGHRFREEILNIRLGDLLNDRGLLAVSETIRKRGDDETRLPDVTVGYLRACGFSSRGRWTTPLAPRPSWNGTPGVVLAGTVTPAKQPCEGHGDSPGGGP